MIHSFKRGRTGVLSCIAFFAAVVLGGFLAFNAHWESAAPDLTDSSASDNVSVRFPSEWAEAASPAAATYAFASADSTLVLFDPNPVYPAPAARQVLASATGSIEPSAPAVSEQAAASPTPTAKPAVAVASLSSAKPGAAAASAKPPVKRSNAVLSEAQLVSIKRRLNLTPEQERYWPAVASELRKMEYRKDQQGGKATAAVDMSKVNVEGLKSAGFPLVMSFNDDQRQELKSLAHLLGLEKVLSGF